MVRHFQTWLVWMSLASALPAADAIDAARRTAALESITAGELQRHVQALADDTFEGREAGSRGGRAAAGYLGRVFQNLRLAGAGTKGGYYQTFGNQYRNLLGRIPGSDPQLAQQVILIGAHYDHVGYGNATNSFGPTGYIHNGADDNASGAAGLLETAAAFCRLDPAPKRSIVFALWDGEEKGLLGSQHWVANPTVPLARVQIAFNMDMIGRLRNNRLETYGVRTTHDLRRVVSMANADPRLSIDFSWRMREDSDHYSFYTRGVPILMLHTGLHRDYHRPSDDAEKVDADGMQRIARLLFSTALELADRPEPLTFRTASRGESGLQHLRERPLPPWPGRLGLVWDPQNENDGLRVVRVAPGGAAARGGVRAGDRIVRMAGHDVRNGADFRARVLAAENPVALAVVRHGTKDPQELQIELAGRPLRLGISWRLDDAEPGTVILSRVVAGSPAARAGLLVNDRVYQIDGREFADETEFRRLISGEQDRLELLAERQGQLRRITVAPPPATSSAPVP